MLNSKDLVKAIKRLVNETVENEKPTRVMYGNVVSISPLKINVEQRMLLERKFLVLTDTVDNELKVNDKVVLLREQGGQKFVVIDKVVSG